VNERIVHVIRYFHARCISNLYRVDLSWTASRNTHVKIVDAGSHDGGERAAAMYSLLETAKFNGIDPEAYLRQVLQRISDLPINRIAELLPWNLAPAALNHEMPSPHRRSQSTRYSGCRGRSVHGRPRFAKLSVGVGGGNFDKAVRELLAPEPN